MPADFLERCRSAREAVSVPVMPLAALRRAALVEPAKPWVRRRTSRSKLLLSITVVVATVAATATGIRQAHFSFGKSGATTVFSDRLHVKFDEHVTDANLRDARAEVDFPVTLPTGIPSDSAPISFMRIGSDSLSLRYKRAGVVRPGGNSFTILLFNPQMLLGSAREVKQPLGVRMEGPVAEQFRAGGEQVMIFGNALTPAEIANIRRSMGGR